MLCGNCQKENPPSNAFCSSCGARLDGKSAVALAEPSSDSRTIYCLKCGAANRPTMRFCRECGAELGPMVVQSNLDPSHRVAAKPESPVGNGIPKKILQDATSADKAVVCPGCNAEEDQNSNFCRFCGTSLAGSAPVQQPVVRDFSPKTPQVNPDIKAQVVIILRNGAEGRVYPLEEENTDIGSREGAIVISDDPFLSHRHARITRKDDTFVLKDLSGMNGVYVRIKNPVELADKDMILIGQQVLRFEMVPEIQRNLGTARQHGVMVFGTPETPRIARLVQYTTEGLERDVYYLNREETVLGREHADVVFPDDPFLSRRHAVISMNVEPVRFFLRDLGSSNGTAVRCRNEHVLKSGDQFRLGRHLFRFDLVRNVGEERN
ncbi:MAG: FHA domain-containing protein [Deltaproteobacteria bacterium]|nr:FHA domain-containing protein [Deltaproteobacteria bacterium]